ncbi:MAG: IPT/TIG domain-containing protein, partial [bacterium]
VMLFEQANAPVPGVSTPANWFRAEGIPITPYDDAGNKNPYPMMRLVARDAANKVIATSDIVLPVSDEMDCRACHGASTQSAAMPAAGWITDTNQVREYRLNILSLHDEREFARHPALFAEALSARGMNPSGLLATAAGGSPILCAACHASEALGAPSYISTNGSGAVPPLTASIHAKHARVMDPVLQTTLNAAENRAACYRCHPGSTTRCLRGAMGGAVAADGSLAMQCQSCHGNMSQVGSPSRVGWFMEPNCQSCHSGTATSNSGQIRYLSVFDAGGSERVPADTTFATTPDTPVAGLSLYRFSVGHGGLQCSACHGSTHAEFPASHRNDNIRNIQLQGHAGVLVECTSCHVTMPETVNGGPHGMHPVGQNWVEVHGDAVENSGLAACQACHGLDYRGTVLSRMQADRTLEIDGVGAQSFFRGATIGCYACHQGPDSEDMNTATAPAIRNVAAQTAVDVPVSLTLPVTLGAGITVRVISQPQNGTVGISNAVATYFPFEGFSGVDTFTFAAYNGAKNSALATGTVTVSGTPAGPQAPAITQNLVSQTVLAGSTVTFTAAANGTAPLGYQWYRNSAAISGATSATLTLAGVTTAAAGNYQVRVSNAAGTASSATATLTVLNAAKISGLSPKSGGVGTAVTITGSYLTGATAVTFNGVAAPFAVVSASTIVAGVPAGATTGRIAVAAPANTALSATTFAVGSTKVVPGISGFSPSSGAVGTVITVSGSNLGGAVAVSVGGVKAAYRVLAAGKLSVTVPSGAVTGKISVSTAGGTGASKGNFTVR